MPTDDKPSRNEQEYFARLDRELMRARRAALDEARATAERAAHIMRCPRCGGHLEERRHHDVTVDVCADCGGTWLDKGELEQLEHFEHVDAIDRSGFLKELFGLRR